MQRVLQLFLDICRLRAGPQDVPAVSLLLLLALIAYAVAGLATAWPGNGPLHAVSLVAADILVLAGVVRLGLRVYRRPARFPQTFTALLGCGALFGLAGLPLILSVGPQLTASDTPQLTLPVLALFVLMAWNITVNGHILRHAFDRRMATGVVWSLLYLYLSWNVSAVVLKMLA